MASLAEARIRDKTEALLRREWPEARIVHEFDLGGVRLDLAAITPERLILAEIKSENDTLARLDRQMKVALRVGGPVIVCHAARWRGKVHDAVSSHDRYRIEWLEEGDNELTLPYPMRLAPSHDRYCNRSLMWLLLKTELFPLAKPFGAKAKHTVHDLQNIVHENLNGREIRLGALAALRARPFGWTCDAPVLTDHQSKEG
jgi:hypothetical protein